MFSYTLLLSMNSQLFRVIYLGKKHVSKIPGQVIGQIGLFENEWPIFCVKFDLKLHTTHSTAILALELILAIV